MKDAAIDPHNNRVNGLLETKSYEDIANRSWVSRTVGYDHVLSIEHEDGLMSVHEGLTEAAAFLNEPVIAEPVGAMWWA